ncbi:MarC family protein [Bradyrhizobium sp. USDA 4353]
MTLSAHQLILFVISLLAMFSPLAIIGPVATLLQGAPVAVQRRIALLVARNYVLVMCLTIALGQIALKALGISTAALTCTGGVALLHQGWPLFTRAGKAADRDIVAAKQSVQWETLTAVPLTFPLTIGGGTIAVVIGTAALYPSWPELVLLSAACLMVSVVVFTTFLFAGRLVGSLSVSAVDAVNRISGIILFALGIELTVKGLKDLVLYGGAQL